MPESNSSFLLILEVRSLNQEAAHEFDLVSASAICFASVRSSCCDSVFMVAGRQAVESLFRAADIQINGTRAWDIQVHDERFFPRILAGWHPRIWRSYMDGWWDCEALDEMCCRALAARLEERFTYSLRNLIALAISFIINHQTRRRSRRVGETHYDLGNDFFPGPCSIPGCNIRAPVIGG